MELIDCVVVLYVWQCCNHYRLSVSSDFLLFNFKKQTIVIRRCPVIYSRSKYCNRTLQDLKSISLKE